MGDVVIIDYGAGNVQSIKYAFNRLGVDPVLSSDVEEIRNAARVIFPGVGNAQSAMTALKQYGLDKIIPELKQPVLGICLGMQLMCEYSEEGGTIGLGIIPCRVKQFITGEGKKNLKIPHMGWNLIDRLQGDLFAGLNAKTYVYFVHSYYVPLNQYSIAITDYIQPFCAALNKENFYACQFHPEKSGKAGEMILKNFLTL